MLHALHHRLELGCHQTARLRDSDTQSILEPSGGQPVQRAGGCGGRRRAEDHARVPTARKHLTAVQCQPNTRADLVAEDGGEQELRASGSGSLTGHGHHGRKHKRVGVQGCGRKVVVEFEALDEAAVEHGC